MRFLSVADRELRSAARQKATYRTRWLTATLFFVLLLWLLWAMNGFTDKTAPPRIFKVYSILTFLYCLFLGTACTADCISAERREGTLGLLFLTNLNSAEIIAGKLCSTALASVYSLLAIFPMLALPLLMGGVSLAYFARAVLGLLNGILFALAAGFLVSVMCKRQFTAIALAMGLTLGIGGGLILGAEAARAHAATRLLTPWLAGLSPLYVLLAADGTRPVGTNSFWQSAAAVAGVSLGWLGLATFLLSRTWRDRPTSGPAWLRFEFRRRSERAANPRRAGLRRRMLGINPLFWLAGRHGASVPVFAILAFVLTAITVYVAAPYFIRTMGAGAASPVAGHMFAWFWTGLAVHAVVLYYAAMSASQRLAEDRHSGALELILCTPTSERTISRGLWLAYGRRMFLPGLLALAVHTFFIWMLVALVMFDPPGPLPRGATAGQIFWNALLNLPLRGRFLDWQCVLVVRIPTLILLLAVAGWVTLGWVGRWLGLRMKHPGFAPMSSLALLLGPPTLLFTVACYLADKLQFSRLPERQFIPMMMWLAAGIGGGHCLLLSLWAAGKLRRHLRAVAMSRYQPLPAWGWRLPTWRGVRRFALTTGGIIAALGLLMVTSWGYQNWQSRRAWKHFQAALRQRGESLDLARLLPDPAPNESNFAHSQAFTEFLTQTNSSMRRMLERLRPFDLTPDGYQGNPILTDWNRQASAPLQPFVDWSGRQPGDGATPDRKQTAAALLKDQQTESGLFRELAVAAAKLPDFQAATNRDSSVVLLPVGKEVFALERMHLLFETRACAELSVGQSTSASEDVLTGLRLANLARRLPDVRSTQRVQALLARSLQPLWEGLSQHAWTETQLAAFQNELSGFDLLADYTNAVRRIVLAHIEVWRSIPEGADPYAAQARAAPRSMGEAALHLQPRAWWFDSCIQLHNAGQAVIEGVDSATGRIQAAINWSDLSGLQLDSASTEVLQQGQWWWRGAHPVAVTFVETAVRQAVIACALERFRLAQQTYPETLDKLVPVFLPRIPHDPVSGRNMVYQYLDSGRFILRGVGPNGIDDRKNKTSDDWLWCYGNYVASETKKN